jgi:antitoxin ParD1/3/4
MPTRSVGITDHFNRFIDSGVDSGRFNDASDVVGEALRLLEQREAEDQARLEWLRDTTREGIPLKTPEDVHALVFGALDESRRNRLG